jgi:hypothetical protein
MRDQRAGADRRNQKFRALLCPLQPGPRCDASGNPTPMPKGSGQPPDGDEQHEQRHGACVGARRKKRTETPLKKAVPRKRKGNLVSGGVIAAPLMPGPMCKTRGPKFRWGPKVGSKGTALRRAPSAFALWSHIEGERAGGMRKTSNAGASREFGRGPFGRRYLCG